MKTDGGASEALTDNTVVERETVVGSRKEN